MIHLGDGERKAETITAVFVLSSGSVEWKDQSQREIRIHIPNPPSASSAACRNAFSRHSLNIQTMVGQTLNIQTMVGQIVSSMPF